MRLGFKAVFLFTIITLGTGVFTNDAYAKKTFFEGMFGWMSENRQAPDPADTLTAPFAYQGSGQSQVESLEDKQQNIVPLKHAHTTSGEIGKWLMGAVSNAMSYSLGDNTDVSVTKQQLFSQGGIRQFKDFLSQNNIQKVMDSGQYSIRSFVSAQPLLLNSQSAANRYRWLFEVPVMMSYMKGADFNYKEAQPINQQLVLIIQVGRYDQIDDPENIHGVLIETWALKEAKTVKN